MKEKVCAILQPHYLPWLGYFEMIDRVDLFVYLDDVQFIKREWKNRNKIRKTATATETKWLTVPIDRASQRGPINEAKFSNAEDWVSKHLSAIRETYGKTPYYNDYGPKLENALRNFSTLSLAELNIGLLREICDWLGITTQVICSSELNVTGKREEKLRNICVEVGASKYLANNATATYVAPDYFQEMGIAFETQSYSHPKYVQSHRSEQLPFLEFLSIVDLLFNHGDESLSVIWRGRPPKGAESIQGNS
ncbi:MAG: hypothetical protein CMM52_16490 [Rhodospirillaceae bacterium]|nr:hypothetical protein [Rhodospirillaceae bacterium]|tara:strand:- start:36135 stop:36887 length:753 start_codon:yes stop_codon:yes gene_type:complete